MPAATKAESKTASRQSKSAAADAKSGSNVSQSEIKPEKAIRRFDVFAEYNRLDALKDGRPADQAKGHGIWLAKVVASRRYGPKSENDGTSATSRKKPHLDPDAPFKSVGDELQTDET